MSSQGSYLCGLDAVDVSGGEGCVGFVDGVGQIDSAGEVFEDESPEAELGGGKGGEADAKVIGQATEEEACKASLAEIAGKAGGGDAVVFGEG